MLRDGGRSQVRLLFEKMDKDGDGSITYEEAQQFWEKNWKNVNATAMFNEVDDDGNGSVTFAKWVGFWENVVAQPDYSEVRVTFAADEAEPSADASPTRRPAPLQSFDATCSSQLRTLVFDAKQEDVLEEVETIIEGGAWVDFDDGRQT